MGNTNVTFDDNSRPPIEFLVPWTLDIPQPIPLQRRRTRACNRSSAMSGSGRPAATPAIPVTNRYPARSASTTASSCPRKSSFAEAPVSRRPHTSALPIATSSRPQLAGSSPASASPRTLLNSSTQTKIQLKRKPPRVPPQEAFSSNKTALRNNPHVSRFEAATRPYQSPESFTIRL